MSINICQEFLFGSFHTGIWPLEPPLPIPLKLISDGSTPGSSSVECRGKTGCIRKGCATEQTMAGARFYR